MLEQKTRAAVAADRLQAVTSEMLAEVDRLPAKIINWIPSAGVSSVMDILCPRSRVRPVLDR